jgi:hypothetical protein
VDPLPQKILEQLHAGGTDLGEVNVHTGLVLRPHFYHPLLSSRIVDLLDGLRTLGILVHVILILLTVVGKLLPSTISLHVHSDQPLLIQNTLIFGEIREPLDHRSSLGHTFKFGCF